MFKTLGNIFGALKSPSGGTALLLHPSDTCPECGSQLAREASADAGNAPWRCPNPDCPPQVRGRVVHWCSPEAMAISGCDAALVAQLVNRGLARDPAELFRLRRAEVAALDGMDDKKAEALLNEIAASKTREAWRVLYGLMIPQVDLEAAKILCGKFRSLDDLFAAGKERIQKMGDVSETVAHSLAYWHGDPVNRKLVKRLWKAGVNFKTEMEKKD